MLNKREATHISVQKINIAYIHTGVHSCLHKHVDTRGHTNVHMDRKFFPLLSSLRTTNASLCTLMTIKHTELSCKRAVVTNIFNRWAIPPHPFTNGKPLPLKASEQCATADYLNSRVRSTNSLWRLFRQRTTDLYKVGTAIGCILLFCCKFLTIYESKGFSVQLSILMLCSYSCFSVVWASVYRTKAQSRLCTVDWYFLFLTSLRIWVMSAWLVRDFHAQP